MPSCGIRSSALKVAFAEQTRLQKTLEAARDAIVSFMEQNKPHEDDR
jgi:hypothetical protein